jgi:hypothetical protein
MVDKMNKSAVMFALIGISIAFSMAAVNVQSVPTYTAGVSPNQAATYSYVGNTGFNSQTVIHIRSVSGSIMTYRRDSGTTDIPINVSKIIIYNPWYCVSTGMVVSDRFQSDNPSYIVIAIVTKSFAGQSWTALQMNATVGDTTINALFDQATGLMLYFFYYKTTGPLYHTFVLLTLAPESAIPIDPAWIILMLMAGLGAAIMVVSRKTVIHQ